MIHFTADQRPRSLTAHPPKHRQKKYCPSSKYVHEKKEGMSDHPSFYLSDVKTKLSKQGSAQTRFVRYATADCSRHMGLASEMSRGVSMGRNMIAQSGR